MAYFGMKEALLALAEFLDAQMGPNSASSIKFLYPVQRTSNPLIPEAWTARIRRDRDYIEEKSIGEDIDHFSVGLDITVEALDELAAWDLLDDLLKTAKIKIRNCPKLKTITYPNGAFLQVVVTGTTYYSAPNSSEQEGYFAMGTIGLDMQRFRELNSCTLQTIGG